MSGPPELDATVLAQEALKQGVLIEPGNVFFADANQGKNYFRLGFSSIHADKIPKGIELLSETADKLLRRSTKSRDCSYTSA
ncbi:hypothetical protein ACQU0X_01355 [Pseudovibrio ascidiaceicola]|uniref:hypothetical protein n=1 Tax=Pseudovibrio ascidiaceicola TaxID=285279 RepID=UPI003D35C82B